MKLIRTDQLRPGDLILGTEASGNYEDGSRRVDTVTRAPEHEARKDGMTAWWVTWADGQSQVYYGDTRLWLQQRLS